MKHIKKLKNKKIILIIVLVLLVAAAPFVYVYGFGGNLFGWSKFYDDDNTRPGVNKPRDAEDDEMKREGNQNHSAGDADSSGDTNVVDGEGEGVNEGDSGAQSESGDITLIAPADGQRLQNGDTIRGRADTSSVSYRLEDDVRGVIGMGELQVKDGKFSGQLSLNTSGKNGTLDVYSFDSQGREINNIRIKVTY